MWFYLDWALDKIIDRITQSSSYIAPSDCLYVPAAHDRMIVVNRKNMPVKAENITRVVVVSDTHGMHEKLGTIPQGDVFVHCGDILVVGRLFSKQSQEKKLTDFNNWLATVPCLHKIVIAGNHDEIIQKLGEVKTKQILSNATYLENTGVSLCGLSFWGTPCSELKVSSSNRAFQNGSYPGLAIEKRPNKVDVLVTHGHCPDLKSSVDHKVHLWGHAHRSYGVRFAGENFRNEILSSLSICAAVPGANYSLENGPIVVDICQEDTVEDANDPPPAPTQQPPASIKKPNTGFFATIRGCMRGYKVAPSQDVV